MVVGEEAVNWAWIFDEGFLPAVCVPLEVKTAHSTACSLWRLQQTSGNELVAYWLKL